MTWFWIAIGLLAAAAGLRHRQRVRAARFTDQPPEVDDEAVRRILAEGTLRGAEDGAPLDPEEVARAEEEFWEETSWDDPEEYHP